jgi:nitroimidazol reductase NimA-like FMN-containing flavoprotein (pyridoxamine 5'-phosphate oxidase superfamily)
MPKLSPDEIEEMLGRPRGHLHLATISADGSPSVVPIGFTFRDRTIYLTARARNQWLADIRRDPRVSVSIDDFDYYRRKIIVKGEAKVVYEPGQDDEWRDLRLPLATDYWEGPREQPDGTVEWNWNEAYTAMTRDEPRALVGIPLEGSRVTSWRMPAVGEYLHEAWSSSYHHAPPRRFRVTQLGESPDQWRVVEEPA